MFIVFVGLIGLCNEGMIFLLVSIIGMVLL